MANIIDGKKIADEIKESLGREVSAFKKQTGITPGLATVLVGKNPASQVYIKNKIISTKACGMESIHHDLPENTTQQELLQLITQLNGDASVHGILVQMPLPKHISAEAVLNAIAPHKDADGFHPANMGRLLTDTRDLNSVLLPCTPLGVMELLKRVPCELAGKDAIVLGRSAIVGKPVSMLLLAAHATVTIAHSRTQNLADKVRQADVVVAAVGIPRFVKGDWIKKGAVIIDVGINRLDDGKLCGDVDFEGASAHAGYITPVPGGVGPMTIAMLLANTMKAAKAGNHA